MRLWLFAVPEGGAAVLELRAGPLGAANIGVWRRLDVLVGLEVLEVKMLVVHVQQLGRVVRLGALGTPQSNVGVLLLKK